MAESIFSFSNVILFGVTMEDLDIAVDRGAYMEGGPIVRVYAPGLPTIESTIGMRKGIPICFK